MEELAHWKSKAAELRMELDVYKAENARLREIVGEFQAENARVHRLEDALDRWCKSKGVEMFKKRMPGGHF